MNLIDPFKFAVPFVLTPIQQKAVNGSFDPNSPVVMDSSLTIGNAVIVSVSHLSTTSVTTVATNNGDSNVDVFTQQVTKNGTGISVDIWSFTNITSALGAIIIDGTALGLYVANISEWSGLSNGNATSTNNNSATASSTVTTNSVTPASARNLIYAGGGWTANDYSSGPTNSFTRLTQIGTTGIWQESAYLTQNIAAAKSTGWGLTAGINWAAAIATFNAP